MFTAEFETAQETGRRRAPRAPVSLDASLGRGGLDRTLCKVTDLSTNGARLHTYSAMKKGTVIWLTLPVVGQIAATVMWADDYEAGCQFQEAIDEQTFELLTAGQAK